MVSELQSRVFFENCCSMIRAARQRRNMTQKELADILQTSQTNISRLENCDKNTSLYLFVSAARFLEINLSMMDRGSNRKIKM